jgi:hypothetical protein
MYQKTPNLFTLSIKRNSKGILTKTESSESMLENQISKSIRKISKQKEITPSQKKC